MSEVMNQVNQVAQGMQNLQMQQGEQQPVEQTTFKLSTGEVVEIKPLTFEQAKRIRFLEILRKVAKAQEGEEEKEPKDPFLGLTEDEIFRVVSVYYSKAGQLTFGEVFKLFMEILKVNMQYFFV